jgi:hypothetical protein
LRVLYLIPALAAGDDSGRAITRTAINAVADGWSVRTVFAAGFVFFGLEHEEDAE